MTEAIRVDRMRPLDSHMVIVLQGLLLLMQYLTRHITMAQNYDDYYDSRSDEVPYFLPGPTNVSVYKGDTAVLICSIQNLGTKTVIWRRASDPNPLTIGQSVYVGDGRYTAESNEDNDEWRLMIHDAKASDAGVYECQVSSKIKRIHHILLRVNVTARPQRKNYVNYKKEAPNLAVVTNTDGEKDITVAGSKFVEKGDPIHLVCNATGSLGPPGTLDWFKNGIKLTPDGVRQVMIEQFTVRATRTRVSVLDVKHSLMSDAGTYVCRSDLSITSTKVHVLNAGSPNVRRGTSATDTKGKGGKKKGGKKTEDIKEAENPAVSKDHTKNIQTQSQTDSTKDGNRSVSHSYSSALICVMLIAWWCVSRMQNSELGCR